MQMDSNERRHKDLALVGVGYWGKNLARNFNALGVLRLLCDSSESTLAICAAGFPEVGKISGFQQVLHHPGVKKVAIAAPASTHYQLVKSALLAGKDVFVEKPLCLEASQAEEVVGMAMERGCTLMVGHLLQYHPCVRKLQELVRHGKLGKLQYITSNRLNLGKIRREENALWSFAPHDLSVILSLVGDQLPEEVRCTGGAYLNDGVPDTTLTILRFRNGVRAHVFVSWLNPFKEQKLTVVGSNGMVVFDDTRPWAEKLALYREHITWTNGQIPTPNKGEGEPLVVPESEPLREECEHFLTCCQERQRPRTDGFEGLRVLQVLQAAQRSLERDGEAARLGDGGHLRESRTEKPASGGAPTSAPDLGAGAGPVSVEQRGYFAHPTAVIDDGAVVGAGTKIWHFSHVMKGARIGERCVLGQNVNVDGGTRVGNNVKIQNNVSVYTGVEIEDDVFLGPSSALTNVRNPRSQINRHRVYEKTVIKRGATVGANATIICGVTLGRYCFIGAGAVVTKDVPDYALMVGNPARQKGWMSRHGHLLRPDPGGTMVCPESGLRYQETESGFVRCLDLDEEAPLPSHLTAAQLDCDQSKAKPSPGHS